MATQEVKTIKTSKTDDASRRGNIAFSTIKVHISFAY